MSLTEQGKSLALVGRKLLSVLVFKLSKRHQEDLLYKVNSFTLERDTKPDGRVGNAVASHTDELRVLSLNLAGSYSDRLKFLWDIYP